MKPKEIFWLNTAMILLSAVLTYFIGYNHGRSAQMERNQTELLERGYKLHHPKTGEVIWRDSLKIEGKK